jgi:membrane-associated phospholipid phosphatase
MLPLLASAQVNEEYIEASLNFKNFGQQLSKDSVFSFSSRKGIIPSMLCILYDEALLPFRMTNQQSVLLIAAISSTFAIYNYDSELDKPFKTFGERNPVLDNISKQFTELGDYYGYALLAGYGGYSLIFHKYRGFHISVLAAQAATSAGIWTRAGKILFGRMRPGSTYNDPEYKSDHWFGPFGQFLPANSHRGVPSFDAFPSGHTAAAFAMATVFSNEYSEMKAMPYVMYTMAGLVGITRLIRHEHWASDVFAGAVTGYLCGKHVCNYYKKNSPSKKLSLLKRTTVMPFYGTDGGGLSCVMGF